MIKKNKTKSSDFSFDRSSGNANVWPCSPSLSNPQVFINL